MTDDDDTVPATNWELLRRNLTQDDSQIDSMHRLMNEKINAGFNMGCAATTGTTTTAPAATVSTAYLVERISAAVKKLAAATMFAAANLDTLGQSWRDIALYGIDPGLLPRDPNRVHKRRRWDRTGSYHRRIQKKWNKRFGTRAANACYVADRGRTIYAAPAVVAEIRKAL